jgi:hypothetical protein
MTLYKPFSMRRTHDRYKIEGGKIGVINHLYTKTGYIYDISMGGLAFHYVDNGQARNEFPFLSMLSITIKKRGFFLQDIAFKTITDRSIQPAFLEMRQRSIQFIEVPQEKKFHLEYLISELTSEKIRDNRSGRDRRERPLQSCITPAPLFQQIRSDRRAGVERRSLHF